MTDEEHYHIKSKTPGGVDLADCIRSNKINASLDYLGLIQQVTKNRQVYLPIEDVVRTLQGESSGMIIVMSGWALSISRCSGGCHSVSWN